MAVTETLRGLTYVNGPTLRAWPGGLLAVAEVREAASGAPELRGYAYETESAAVANLWDSAVSPQTSTQGITVKQALTGFEISAFAEVNALTAPEYDPEARALQRLALGEARAVERGFVDYFLAPSALDITPTPGTAVRPSVAVALLLRYAGQNYDGLPILHAAPRSVTQLGAEPRLIDWMNGLAYTCSLGAPVVVSRGATASTAVPGNPVAAGGSGTAAAAPGANQTYLYATGSVLLYRSPVEVHRGQYLPTNADGSFAFRSYVPSIETFTVAVLTDLS